MTTNTKRAADLQPGDVYSYKGRTPRKVIKTIKRGAWVLVIHAYRVSTDHPLDRGPGWKWYHQPIPPIDRLHVNKVLTLDAA